MRFLSAQATRPASLPRSPFSSVKDLRSERGASLVVPGGCFLGYLCVVPERRGHGTRGLLLDEVLAEATRRRYAHIHLWIHDDNERSHRLSRSRGFAPPGRSADGEAEWVRDI